MIETINTDVLIIGGGGAATRAAIEAAVSGARVDLVDKGVCGESGSSPRCLRGFAGMFDKQDSPERFLEDWLRTSGFISDRNLVWEAIIRSRIAADGLEDAGVEFVTNPDGTRVLYRGAGHTVARGLTAKTPNTAAKLRKEAERRGAIVHEGIMITKLLERQNRVVGAVGVSGNRDLFVFSAKALILAAGGANRLYPNVASQIGDPRYRTTGDSFCLALEAGAPLIDMEFTQFRDSPPGASRFGENISTAWARGSWRAMSLRRWKKLPGTRSWPRFTGNCRQGEVRSCGKLEESRRNWPNTHREACMSTSSGWK